MHVKRVIAKQVPSTINNGVPSISTTLSGTYYRLRHILLKNKKETQLAYPVFELTFDRLNRLICSRKILRIQNERFGKYLCA